MKLGRGGSCSGGGLGLIASFSLCPPFPVETDAVIARLALAFTIVTFRSFFPTLDLPILAGPVLFSKHGCDVASPTLTNNRCDSASWARRFRASSVEACRREAGDGRLTGALDYDSCNGEPGLNECFGRKCSGRRNHVFGGVKMVRC